MYGQPWFMVENLKGHSTCWKLLFHHIFARIFTYFQFPDIFFFFLESVAALMRVKH